MNANRVIAEATKLACYHKWGEMCQEKPQIGRQECSLCGEWTYTGEYQPDFAAEHYMKLMEWMREDALFGNLLRWYAANKESHFGFMAEEVSDQITLIAEWLESEEG